MIARLRSDQALWEFKRAVAELIRDVEQKYWELYAAQWQHWAINQALETNREIVNRLTRLLEVGTGNASDRYEAEVQYQQLLRQRLNTIAGTELSAGQRVAGVQVVERQLRNLLGLPPADGFRIIAVDDPQVAPFRYDWESEKREAFTSKVPWRDLNGNLRHDPGELDRSGFVGFASGLFPPIADDANRPYSDEINIGVDHQLLRDLAVSVSYHRRQHRAEGRLYQ